MSWHWVALIIVIGVALVLALWAPYVDWDRELHVIPCSEPPCPVVMSS